MNSFIVSQCNPYLLPLVGFKRWLPRKLAVLWETEFKHRCGGIVIRPRASSQRYSDSSCSLYAAPLLRLQERFWQTVCGPWQAAALCACWDWA